MLHLKRKKVSIQFNENAAGAVKGGILGFALSFIGLVSIFTNEPISNAFVIGVLTAGTVTGAFFGGKVFSPIRKRKK